MANTSWVFADFILRQGLNILVGVFVARYLGPSKFGLLSYSGVYMQILMPVALLGLSQITIRELIKKEIEPNKILGTTFLLKILASTITLILISILVFSFEKENEIRAYVLIASASILFTPFQVIDFYFQAEVKSKYVVISQQIAGATTSIIRVFLVIASASLVYFIWIYVVEAFITSLALVFTLYLQKESMSRWKIDIKIFKFFSKEITSILLSSFFVALYVRIDQVMIRYLSSENELGIYTAAVKLCEPFYVIATLLVSSLFPAIVNGLKISELEYKTRLQNLYNMLVWIAITTSLIISFLAPTIVNLVYGIEFKNSVPVLIIYFWASPFVFLGVVGSNALMIEKKQSFTVITTFLGAFTNILLNFTLIPLFGVKGAALATLVSYAAASYLFNVFFKASRQVFIQQTIALFSPKKTIKSFKNFISNNKNT